MKNLRHRVGLCKAEVVFPSLLILLTACSQEFGVALKKAENIDLPKFCQLADGSVVPSESGSCPGGSSTGGTTGTALNSKTLEFNASAIQNKIIDVVMVIDDSGSMQEEQNKVRDGLSAVASQYLSHANYTQSNLDVCVHVISSSYYINSPSSQGFVGCTTNSSINLPSLVDSKVNLGTGGSGYEFLGKSLVTYLGNQSSFDTVLSAQSLTLRSGFRPGATLALVMVTDENNYFAYSRSTLGVGETFEAFQPFQSGSGKTQPWDDAGNWLLDRNDIPSVTNKLRRSSAREADLNNLVQDTRVGIKNYLELFGFDLNKVTTLNFLKSTLVDGVLAPAPLQLGPSMGDKNLFQLKSDLGNGAINADIDANSSSYTSQFQQLFANSVSIQSQFPLSPAAATTVGMQVIRVRGNVETALSSGDYSLVAGGSALQLSAQAASQLQSGDQIRVTYFY